jgi:prephenate dehydrogenase
MNLLVVGAGTMGRWFGENVAGVADVSFADTDPDAAARAATAVGGRTVALDTEESFTAVCLAVPMGVVTDAVAAHAGRAERALLDVSGVMEPVVAAMRESFDGERVSLHPLFAAENAPGNVAVVADEPGPVSDALLDALRDRENHLFETTAAEHDEAMATVQARAHTAVLAYALAAADVREEFHTPLSGPLQELVEQVTGGTPRVYAEIQAAFPGAEDVAAAARRIADADAAEFEHLYEDARR